MIDFHRLNPVIATSIAHTKRLILTFMGLCPGMDFSCLVILVLLDCLYEENKLVTVEQLLGDITYINKITKCANIF